MLPDDEWTCEEMELVKIIGEKGSEEPAEKSKTDKKAEDAQVADSSTTPSSKEKKEVAPPLTIELVREEAKKARKKGVEPFDDEKEMNDLVRLCESGVTAPGAPGREGDKDKRRNNAGVDCRDSMFKMMRKIAKKNPNKK
jgi:hypothetical protein